MIVTKSHHVADDEYMAIYDPELAHIQISISLYTIQQDVYWQMPLNEKLKVLKKIKGKIVSVCEDNTECRLKR